MKRPSGCRGCPFDDGGVRDEFCPFSGPLDAKLAAIAEAPAENEVRADPPTPLIGPSGYQFNTALRFAGIKREDVLVGNTILCKAPRDFRPDDSGWAGAIAHCARAHTGPLLDKVKPRAVVLMGGPALLRHTGFRTLTAHRGHYSVTLNGIEEVRGSSYRASELADAGPVAVRPALFVDLPKWGGADPVLVPTLHPSYLLQGNQHLKPLLVHDIERALRWATGTQVGPTPSLIDFTLKATSVEMPDNEVAFDTETDENDRPDMIGLGFRDHVWVSRPTQAIAQILATPGILKTAHNMSFDIKVMGGAVAAPWFDSIMAAALVQPALPRSLASTTSLYGGDYYWYWKDLPDNPRTQAVTRARMRLAADFLLFDWLYNGLDVWWLMKIKPVLVAEMRHYKVLDLFWNVHMALAPELLEIERVGMPVDVAKMAKRKAETKAKVDSMSDEVRAAVAARASVRARAAVDSLVHVTSARMTAIGQLPRCALHPDYDGTHRKTACGGCNALWVAAKAIRDADKKTVDKAKGTTKRYRERPFDVDSPADWRWLVYAPEKDGGLGLKSPMRTAKTSAPSLNKDALRGLLAQAGLSDEARRLLMARYEIARLSSRISKYLSLPVADDGRVHAAYAQHVTMNARFSSGLDDSDEDKPNSPYSVNAQNFPEDCRDIVVARSGWCIVNFDFSMIEDWTTALSVWKLTGSRAYFDLLASGADVHQMTADLISRRLTTKVTRRQGKTGRHGWKYGMKAKKLAITRAGEGITFELAKEIIGALNEMHPDIVQWQGKRIDAVRRSPTQRQAFGRVCHFTLTRGRGANAVDPDEPNEVIAWEPASMAHDIAKLAWLRLRANRASLRLGDAALLINHSHDSFTFEVRDDPAWVAEFIERVKAILESPVEQLRSSHPDGVPFVPRVDVQVGYNWGPHHVHGPVCATACEKQENPDGLADAPVTVVA